MTMIAKLLLGTAPFWAPEGTEAAAAAEPEVQVEAKPEGEAQVEAKSEGEAEPEVKVEAKADDAAPPAGATEKEKEDWRDKRIAKLTAKLRESERAKVEPPKPGSAEEDEARIQAEVSRRAANDAFNKACNDAAAAGRKDFGEAEFNSRVGSLTKLVDKDDLSSIGAYNQFLAAALETGEASKLIFELGGDLNLAEKIMSLPPLKMAVELTKLASRKAEGEEISSAPKPIRPVNGSAPHSAISASDTERADKLSTAEWMKRREAEVAGRSGNGARR